LRVTLLHNPTAGDEEHNRDHLLEALAEADHETVYQSTKEDGWTDALDRPADLVVAAGGDGTMDKVFRALAGGFLPVAVLPLGSANNVARTLGISLAKPTLELARSWQGADRRPFDIGELQAGDGAVRFVECMGGGIFGDVLVRAGERDEELSAGEKQELGLDLLEAAIRDAPAYTWAVELDGEDLSGEFLAVEVMNVREIGPNVPLAPEAEPGDGLLDVALVSAGHREGLAACLRARERDRHIPPPAMRRARGGRLRVRFPAGCSLHVDDELWPGGSVDGAEREAVLTAGPLQVQVLQPADAFSP
jgi:diacylglycerol kinase family enzyme